MDFGNLSSLLGALQDSGGDADVAVTERDPVLPSLDLDGLVHKITEADNIIVMAGAGISVSAGIPDFRTPGTGLYDNLQKYDLPEPEAIFDIDYFQENPGAFYSLAKELYPGQFAPTPAHYFCRLLSDKNKLLRMYTQNIDSLETLAGLPSDKVVAAHGNFDTAHVITGPRIGTAVDVNEVREAILAGEPGWRAMVDKYEGLVKPDIVFFGEGLPKRFHRLLQTDFDKCDLLIVMGTSLKVQPFASLIDMVNEDVPRALWNREAVAVRDPATSAMAQRLAALDPRLAAQMGMGGFVFEGPQAYRDVFCPGDCDATARAVAHRLGWVGDLEARIAHGATQFAPVDTTKGAHDDKDPTHQGDSVNADGSHSTTAAVAPAGAAVPAAPPSATVDTAVQANAANPATGPSAASASDSTDQVDSVDTVRVDVDINTVSEHADSVDTVSEHVHDDGGGAAAAPPASAAPSPPGGHVSGVWRGSRTTPTGSGAGPVELVLSLMDRTLAQGPVSAFGCVYTPRTSGAAEACVDETAAEGAGDDTVVTTAPTVSDLTVLHGKVDFSTGTVSLSSCDGQCAWTGTLSMPSDDSCHRLKGMWTDVVSGTGGTFECTLTTPGPGQHAGLWIGAAQPIDALQHEVPVNPIKWCLSHCSNTPCAGQPPVLGVGFFDDAGDIPGFPVLFFRLQSTGDSGETFLKVYEPPVPSFQTVTYKSVSMTRDDCERPTLRGEWENTLEGTSGTFIATLQDAK
eukprot:m.202423 g.202423  ORF g.202423 m.202423 type:complete len:741 (+) comp21773_c0_seq1:255-2477(+)